jgi:hypothetical protein
MKYEIYPGSGACELCGEIVPCQPCLGTLNLRATARPKQAYVQTLIVSKQDYNQEKTNSISASITKE